MVDMVDNLLDVLTSGEHSKTAKIMEERKQMKEDEEKFRKLMAEKAEPPADPFHDIDLSMLEKDGGRDDGPLSPRHRELQDRLDHTGRLLTDLARIQHQRLSAEPPTHLSHITGPTESETELGESRLQQDSPHSLLTLSLCVYSHSSQPEASLHFLRVSKSRYLQEKRCGVQVTPSSIVTIEGVRKALGISYNQEPRLVAPQQPPSPTPVEGTQYLTTPEIDLTEFLNTGPTLRVCDSPTFHN
ncbi:BRD7 [Cordylochernes scorpioides]|uniref:BRD7 n=1 Tax=Cordylochernes scorpioides TaxID=51811 RepID=A0ABY6LHN8_9ARAC|nr:BRD7 [Cordylochernes scorpioides]